VIGPDNTFAGSKNMKLVAHSREEYFNAAGDRGPILRELDKVIRKAAPKLKPFFIETPTMAGLAYGSYHYKYASGREADWPVIGLGVQKNHLSLYVCVAKNGQYLAEIYRESLGKVSCGKSCIRFKKIEDLNLDVVRKLCSEAAELSASSSNFQM
jgi:hypothetical protein